MDNIVEGHVIESNIQEFGSGNEYKKIDIVRLSHVSPEEQELFTKKNYPIMHMVYIRGKNVCHLQEGSPIAWHDYLFKLDDLLCVLLEDMSDEDRAHYSSVAENIKVANHNCKGSCEKKRIRGRSLKPEKYK